MSIMSPLAIYASHCEKNKRYSDGMGGGEVMKDNDGTWRHKRVDGCIERINPHPSSLFYKLQDETYNKE